MVLIQISSLTSGRVWRMPDDNFENDEQTSRDHVSRDDLKNDLPSWMFSRMNCGACRPGSRYQTQNKSWMSMARLALASKDLFSTLRVLRRIQADVDRRGSCISQGSGAGSNWRAPQALVGIGLAQTSFTRRTFPGTNTRLTLLKSHVGLW